MIGMDIRFIRRQVGLDVVMLGLGDPGKPAETKPWVPALILTDNKNADESPKLYLFEPAACQFLDQMARGSPRCRRLQKTRNYCASSI